jgi:hypothetical protein
MKCGQLHQTERLIPIVIGDTTLQHAKHFTSGTSLFTPQPSSVCNAVRALRLCQQTSAPYIHIIFSCRRRPQQPLPVLPLTFLCCCGVLQHQQCGLQAQQVGVRVWPVWPHMCTHYHLLTVPPSKLHHSHGSNLAAARQRAAHDASAAATSARDRPVSHMPALFMTCSTFPCCWALVSPLRILEAVCVLASCWGSPLLRWCVYCYCYAATTSSVSPALLRGWRTSQGR